MERRDYGQVDFASLDCAWPPEKAAQEAILESICARAWHRSSGYRVNHHLARCGHCKIARITRETRFGRRWFDVWRHPSGEQLLVVKEAAPPTPVVISVELHAAPGTDGISATCSLLSGQALGTITVTNTSAETPLLINDIRQAACERALSHGFLETHRQVVGLVLPGFDSDSPNGLVLWGGPGVTEEALQAWLTYLQSFPAAKLASTHELMGWTSPSTPVTDSSTSGLEDSPRNFDSNVAEHSDMVASESDASA